MDKINDIDTLDKMISKVVRERSSKRNFLPNAVSIDIVKEIKGRIESISKDIRIKDTKQ